MMWQCNAAGVWDRHLGVWWLWPGVRDLPRLAHVVVRVDVDQSHVLES